MQGGKWVPNPMLSFPAGTKVMGVRADAPPTSSTPPSARPCARSRRDWCPVAATPRRYGQPRLRGTGDRHATHEQDLFLPSHADRMAYDLHALSSGRCSVRKGVDSNNDRVFVQPLFRTDAMDVAPRWHEFRPPRTIVDGHSIASALSRDIIQSKVLAVNRGMELVEQTGEETDAPPGFGVRLRFRTTKGLWLGEWPFENHFLYTLPCSHCAG